jgi:tRNA G18 (ribose-2'-O)-methylase SpoU
MFTIHRVQSLELPELAPYRTMRRQMEHRAQGIFVAEGEKVVRRLLESSLPVISLLLPENWVSHLEPLLASRPENIKLFVANKSLLEKLTGFSMYQGVLGLAKIPESLELEDILENSPKPWLLTAADGLTNAENLGALVRNCAAFNVNGLIVGETCCSPFLRRAVRSSMGAIFHLSIFESNCLTETLGQLKKRGVRCIAAHPHVEKQTLSRTNFGEDCCIVFGSEGKGIAESVRHLCDECAAIPMPQTIDSLNVGSAAAVFLYEANRQRNRM